MQRAFAIVALLGIAIVHVSAEGEGMPEPYVGSAEFEQLKSLAGVWKGTMPMGPGGEPMEMSLDIRVIAGGSAILERSMPGSPMEMVTVYHDQGDGLTLTHYCMLGNQPQMDLVGSGEGRFEFSLREGSVGAGEMHMHSVAIAVEGDRMEQTSAMWAGGKEQKASTIELTRVN